jgi:hypothetical protein
MSQDAGNKWVRVLGIFRWVRIFGTDESECGVQMGQAAGDKWVRVQGEMCPEVGGQMSKEAGHK